MTNKTLAIIKPDAVKRNLIGKILSIIEENDFVVSQIKSYHLNAVEAETFYEIHKGKPFYDELITFMSSGQCMVLALEKENAVEEWRNTCASPSC